MTRQIWSEVSAFLSTRARVAAATIALGSAVVGALEAGVLVLVVSSALAAVDGADTVNVDLPAVGNRSIPSTTAIAVAAGASLGILVVHAVMAWMTSRVSAGALHRMRRDAVEAFARASWSRQALEQEGGLQETTSTLSLQSAGLVMHFGQLAMGVAGLTMLLGGALVVSPVATGGVLGFGALVFWPSGRSLQQLDEAHEVSGRRTVGSMNR